MSAAEHKITQADILAHEVYAARRAEHTFPEFEERLLTFVERREQRDPMLDLLAEDTASVAQRTEAARVAPPKSIFAFATSAGAATVLFLKKRHAAGVLAGGVALAVLAAEYPEKFERVRRQLPDYFDRGMHVMEMAARAGKRITEAAGQSAVDDWEEL